MVEKGKCEHSRLLKEQNEPLYDEDGDYYCPDCGERFIAFIAESMVFDLSTETWHRKRRV